MADHLKTTSRMDTSTTPAPDPQKQRKRKQIIRLSILLGPLLCGHTALAQDHGPITRTYSAQLIRSEGFNPLKPMLADVLEWLPEAEITLEREADVLQIITARELTSEELRAHLEPHGVHVGAFLKDGRTLATNAPEGEALPWLSGLMPGMAYAPEEIAARKEAWMRENPVAYERLLNGVNGNPDHQ